MKDEIKIFFSALMFYTRIPCPKNIDHSPEYLNKSTRYFPLIGYIVGAISFVVYAISNFLFDSSMAIVLSLLAGVLTTGAFHEDGLGDVADGFGGGWTKAKILEIMKDSRIGAYGVIALILLFMIKYFALYKLVHIEINIAYYKLLLVFVCYHALARFTAINISFILPYSREDESSKVKPIAKSYSSKEVLGVYVFGLFPLILMSYYYWQFSLVLLPLLLLVMYLRNYFNKWLDGYTGDCLGAAEQIAECVILLSFVCIWKFI